MPLGLRWFFLYMYVFTGALNGKEVERDNRRDWWILSRFQEWV